MIQNECLRKCLDIRKGRKAVMAKKEAYNAGSISVLEGLEGSQKASGYVYRKCVQKGSEPSDL